MNPTSREGNHALIKRLAWLLDSSIRIPGTDFRIGLDAVIGLIPWAGDVAGSLLSMIIVGLAFQAGASRWTLARMGWNVLIELVIGSIPVVGDIFDAAWKSNERNVRLLERSVTDRRARRKDFWFVGLMFLALLSVLALTIYGSYELTLWIIHSFSRSSTGWAT